MTRLHPNKDALFGHWKKDLIIINHTRKHIYSLGDIYPDETGRNITLVNHSDNNDPALQYRTLTRLIFAIRGDDIEILLDEETLDISKYTNDLMEKGYAVFSSLKFDDLPYIEGEKDDSSYRISDLKPD